MPALAYTRVFSYAEISPYIDGPYNAPEIGKQFTIDSFEREYHGVYQTLLGCLNEIGDVDEYSDNGDFSMSKYVPLHHRSITVVVTSEKGASSTTVKAMFRALQIIKVKYVFCLDAPKAFLCIVGDGRVLGYSTDGSIESLKSFGFC